METKIKINHERWIDEENEIKIIKNILKQTGISEEKISKIWKIGFSNSKNLKFINKQNLDKVQTFNTEENLKIKQKFKDYNIKFIKESIAQNLTPEQTSNTTILENLEKDSKGWLIYAEDVNIMKNAIQNATLGKYPAETIAGISFSKKGTVKIAFVQDIFKEKAPVKKENLKIRETAKKLYVIQENIKSENEKKHKNFFTYLYPQINNVISKIKSKVYLSEKIITISINGNNITAHTPLQECSVPFINKEIIDSAEKENASELDNWLESHIQNISNQINAAMKESSIQIQKNILIQTSINEILQNINSTISKKHFKNQETELFFDNNLSQTKKNSTIQIKVKSKDITFQITIPVTRQKLETISKKIICENVEKDYKDINIYFKKEDLETTKNVILTLIEQTINDKKPLYSISPDQVKNALPEKIKKHIKSYENKEKTIPCWLNQIVQKETEAIFYPPNEIIFTNRFFSEKNNSSEELIETEYGKSIQALKKAPLKATLDTAKKLNEKIKKLNLTVNIHKTKQSKQNNSVSYTIKLKDNISDKSYYDNFIQEISNADRNEENNNKINKLIIESQTDRKNTNDLIQDVANNILDIAVADIIFLNKGSSKSAITANLRGSNTTRYKSYMKNNMFTDKLHLIDKEKLENIINKLEHQGIINSYNKKGNYGRFDVYYPNELTNAVHTLWENNMEKILKKNNIILKDSIKNLTEIIRTDKTDTFTIQNFLPLIDDKVNIIDYSMNLEDLKKVFQYAPDDIIKLMSMKKKIINDPIRTKIYNTLIKAQKDYKKLLEKLAVEPEKFELQEK